MEGVHSSSPCAAWGGGPSEGWWRGDARQPTMLLRYRLRLPLHRLRRSPSPSSMGRMRSRTSATEAIAVEIMRGVFLRKQEPRAAGAAFAALGSCVRSNTGLLDQKAHLARRIRTEGRSRPARPRQGHPVLDGLGQASADRNLIRVQTCVRNRPFHPWLAGGKPDIGSRGYSVSAKLRLEPDDFAPAARTCDASIADPVPVLRPLALRV